MGHSKDVGFYSKAMGSHRSVLSRGDIIGLPQSKHLPVWELPLSLSLQHGEIFLQG